MARPAFGQALPQARIAAAAMALFKRRLVSLARFRRRAGLYGRRNRAWHARAPAFDLGGRSVRLLLRALAGWIGLEIEYARHRLLRGAVDMSSPVAEPPSPCPPLLRRRA